MVDPDDANLARAATVFLNVPLSRTSFSISDAMVVIDIPEGVAKTQYYIDKVDKLIKGATQGNNIEGVKFFPGVPNGTEVGQEMDQLFGAFKAYSCQNRKKLLNARIRLHGDNARRTHNDVGFTIL
jgi:hypothetical protein